MPDDDVTATVENDLSMNTDLIKGFQTDVEGTKVALFEKDSHEKIDKLMEKFKGPGGQAKLIKSHLELEAKLGKAVKPLDKGATDRDVADRQKLISSLNNVPEKADGYQLADPQALPEGMVVNENLKNELKLLAHKRNISPDAAQEIYELHNKAVIEAHNQRQKDLDENQKNTMIRLNGKFGAEVVPRRMELLSRLLKGYTSSDEEWQAVQAQLGDSFIGDNYVLSCALFDFAEAKLGEGSTLKDAFQKQTEIKSLREKHFPKSPDMDK